MKAGLRPKEEAMGGVPPPPHALFSVFLLWSHWDVTNTRNGERGTGNRERESGN